jgi:hypothetical protein
MSWRAISWARKRRAGSHTAKAVLMNLALHADHEGYCWPSQETMAKEIECSVDSVQRALRKLERRFLRRIKRKSSDGRRISDAYQLMLRGPAPCGPADAGDQAAESPVTEPQTDASPGSTVRPKYLEEKIQEPSYRILSATPGGARLAKKLGKVIFDAWFRNVDLVRQQGHVLYLGAENNFIADHIEQQFEDKILECFQPEHKEAIRVRVLFRKETAAPDGGIENSTDPARRVDSTGLIGQIEGRPAENRFRRGTGFRCADNGPASGRGKSGRKEAKREANK